MLFQEEAEAMTVIVKTSAEEDTNNSEMKFRLILIASEAKTAAVQGSNL